MAITVPPINVPQPASNPSQPVNPFPIADSYLNRQQNQQKIYLDAISNLGSGVNEIRQQKIQNQLAALQAYAGIAKAVGPDAANQVAGSIPNIPNWNQASAYQSPAQGTQTNYAQPSGGNQGGSIQTNATPVAGQSPQIMQDTQPSEHIMNSVEMGHPDFTGHLQRINELQSKMASFSNKGDWGREQSQQVAQEIAAEKAAMDAEVMPQDYAAKTQGMKLAVTKPVAEEVSKQGENTTRVGQLRSLFDDLKTATKSVTPGLTAGLSGKIASATGGKFGSVASADLQNVSAPMTAALNYELTKRFNESEANFLMNSMMPKPIDQPAFRDKKLNRLDQMISALESGNDRNIKNVANTIAGRSISTNVGSHQSVDNPINKAITSKAQYDALPEGASYTWNGQPHVKGKS